MSSSRVWLITGTSSGFGRRFVPSVLSRGDRVIATARNHQSISDFPPSDNLRTLELDVSADEATIRRKAEEALAFWGRVDILINNAGYSLKILAEDATLADLQTQFQANFCGAVALTSAILPQMRHRKEGTVVMIGSRSSWNPIPVLGTLTIAIDTKSDRTMNVSNSVVCRVKGGVASEALAQEVAQFSIRILIVEPSGFRTEQNILGYPLQIPENADPAYNSMRRDIQSKLEALDMKQSGDPDKAVEVIVDVVRGEGAAKDRPWPLYLPLGRDANHDVEVKCAKMLETVREWRDVTDHLDVDS